MATQPSALTSADAGRPSPTASDAGKPSATASPITRYVVVEYLDHNGRAFHPGAPITLPNAEAEQLLALGAIKVASSQD